MTLSPKRLLSFLTDWPFPHRIRAFVRARAIGLVGVALVVGALSALLVAGLNASSQLAHELLFGLERGARLSSSEGIPPLRLAAVLVGGGLCLGVLAFWASKQFSGRMADAIEANALHGGRLSVLGSLYIVLQTLISNACGAAVGLEAAYTQICAAFASNFGKRLAARRSDMRLLVACGAAGAISAAFGAPLAGSFYAFEVILGAYSVGSLVPVVASAIVANLISNSLHSHALLDINIQPSSQIAETLAHVLVLAGACAALGIVVMKLVAAVEAGLTRIECPALLRPVVGGACVAALAIITPSVMGSGHGALHDVLFDSVSLKGLALVVALKSVASALSLGAGFRGGLFFASLLIGSAAGRFYAEALPLLTSLHIDSGVAAVAGLAAFGACVLGAPMTMTVLALEMTGDFYVTIAALVAAAVATLINRETFGYSFATWRFHLRGETIRGPADVGRIRELTVGSLMRTNANIAPASLSVKDARAMFPFGAEKQFFLADEHGRVQAMMLTGQLYAPELKPDDPVLPLAQACKVLLTPSLGVREALDAFDANEADVLPVVNSQTDGRIIGQLSEAHALRRYGEELERSHRAILER